MRHQKTHHNITLSFSQSIIDELHYFVKKGGISQFVENAVVEKLRSNKEDVEQQYIEAAQDEERNKIFLEWEQMVGDGLNEQNKW